MLVVLDSNVLFSGLLSPTGRPYRIYEAWREGRFEVATCLEQMEEIRRASRYPKFRAILQPNLVGTMMNHLHRAQVFKNLPTKYETYDIHDAFLMNLADVAQADYLVTGDKRAGILERKKIGGTRIMTAAQFCEMLDL